MLLLFAAALWGLGNVAQKTVLSHLDALSAVGLRCLIGGLLVLPFVLTERRLPAGPGYLSSLARVAFCLPSPSCFSSSAISAPRSQMRASW
ncbi:EamA family transporter [Mesorhizobium sp. M7A.F.Ca.US.011.01.1.1]|uniref:EamA family transporter n=1 Tax=Mesorhizobium sp. M7A.F.Ca.US.011.01.1.1 TaxID=2496741 RepID=UPI002479EA35|nr:EamA family transporter [Mesorhizobium sp. M7A.F.Ca.US.011.01.1.1]